jgi:hypothetical protein
MDTDFQVSHASGKELEEIMDQLDPILSQYENNQVIMACLATAFIWQDPSITPSRLEDGVFGASQWIANFLANSHTSIAH